MPRLLIAVLLALLVTGSASAQSWREEVNRAIDRGIHVLLKMQRADGAFPVKAPDYVAHNQRYPMGVTSLALYALLNSGVPADDPAIRRAVEYLRYMKFQRVYSVSMLILALDSLHDRAESPWIKRAAKWLENCRDTESRIWGYPEPHPDLSNTQLAALALYVAEKHGYKVRQKTWYELVEEMVERQNADGGFGYRENHWPYSTGTMTTSGITVLHFAREKLKNRRTRAKAGRTMEKGWDWLERVFTTTGNPAWTSGVIRDKTPGKHLYHYFHYYYLYGLERIASLADRPIIADRDWYKEGAIYLLGCEKDGGGWGGLCNTSFALLFLRRVTFTSMKGGDRAASGYPPSRLWLYRQDEPPAGWERPDFDAKGWHEGWAPFGNIGNPNGHVRTPWGKKKIWLRREFHWSRDSKLGFKLYAAWDDVLDIWLNGVKVVHKPTWSANYVEIDVPEAARKTLVRGRNVLAVKCVDNAGARYVDVRLRDWEVLRKRDPKKLKADPTRWWRSNVPPVPSMNRWLVVGPIQDPQNKLLHAAVLREAELAPKEGRKTKGRSWTVYDAPQGLVDLGTATKHRENSVYCAFTWLDVAKTSEAVLWFGASGGAKVYLDGKVILAHYSRQGAKAGEFRVPLRLEVGQRRLLVKVENEKGRAGFIAHLTDKKGKPLAHVRPVLDGRNPRLGEIARSSPTLFTDAQLLDHLKTDISPRLDFIVRGELDRVAVGPSHPGYPKWLARSSTNVAKDIRANPGARGLLAVRAPSKGRPCRVIRKVRVPRGRSSVTVRVSPAEVPPGARPAGVQVRLGVFDGTMHWLTKRTIRSKTPPDVKQWSDVVGGLTKFAAKDVLLVVEVASPGDNALDVAFIDSIVVR